MSELDNLLDNLSTAIVVTDESYAIVYANHAAQTLLQLSKKQLLSFSLHQFFIRESLDFSRLDETLKMGDGFSDSEVQLALVDGRFVTADLTATRIDQGDNKRIMLEIKRSISRNAYLRNLFNGRNNKPPET